MDEEVVKKLKVRYGHVHPLIFHRTIERAKSPGEAFDILETLPQDLPILWSAADRCWVNTDDITQAREMQFPNVQME